MFLTSSSYFAYCLYAVRWPGGAKVALNLVLNYEEGGENCLLHGDGESEKLLSEIVGAGAIGKCECI